MIKKLFLTAINILLIAAFTSFLYIRNNINKKEYSTYYFKTVIQDLTQINAALKKFKEDNGYFPMTNGWSGYYSLDQSSELWIKGLSPKYITKLPREPRKLTDYSQYLYISNGGNFKLINHNTLALEDHISLPFNINPDPIRPKYAIGIWTNNAKNW